MSDFFPSEALIPGLKKWVQDHRQSDIRLDDEADALVMKLLQTEDRIMNLRAGVERPVTVALRNSLSGSLLSAFCAAASGPLFSGMSPSIVTRFTASHSHLESEHPVQLRLLREVELVQLFIEYARCSSVANVAVQCQPVERLQQLQKRRSGQATPRVTSPELARLVGYWQSTTFSGEVFFPYELGYSFAELVPELSLNDRAKAYALFWGDRHDITARWIEMASLLERLGDTETVMAPSSVLNGSAAEMESDDRIAVRPVAREHRLLSEVWVSQADLMPLSVEVVFTGCDIFPCDVLVLPSEESEVSDILIHSKQRYLTNHYPLRWQWDQLLEDETLADENFWSVLARSEAMSLRTRRFSEEVAEVYTELMGAFAPWRSTLTLAQIKDLIEELQGQAQYQGEWLGVLLLPVSCSAWAFLLATDEQKTPIFNAAIDLFTEGENTRQTGHRYGVGERLHRYWVNHIRTVVQSSQLAEVAGISQQALQRLGEIVIMTGYRLNLSEELERAAARSGTCGVTQTLAHFLCWLGYDQTLAEARPVSKVTHRAIFTPIDAGTRRLTRLTAQTGYLATSYVYDWLVALYTRACENLDYHFDRNISDDARQNLGQILDGWKGGH